MESARTFLFVLLAFLTFLLYQEWDLAHQPEPVAPTPVEQSTQTYQTESEALPSAQAENDSLSLQVPGVSAEAPDTSITAEQQLIEVVTDTLKVMISPAGGNLVSAELLNYRVSLEENAVPVNILENRNGRTFLALSGLYGEGAPDYKNNLASYHSKQTQYTIEEGENTLSVDLLWKNEAGVNYTKRFTFKRGEYTVKVEYLVNNQTDVKIANRMFTALRRDRLAAEGKQDSGIGMQSYVGPAYSTSESKYEKYEFDDLDEADLRKNTSDGWVAFLQHYFVTAWVPHSESTNLIDTSNKNLGRAGLTQIRITQDWQWIAPGQQKTFAATLYVGPKVQSALEKVAEGLDLTVDYGFLWWIGQPIFYLLLFFQKLVVNWGGAIILVTIAIKSMLYPLARAQYRSFAKMRLLQPKIAAMKERIGDDKQQMSVKMMELYKKEKVNPLGGCFPLLIQMPVFIALYWVLMESVELRHAPFFLWINDLAVKDPYYVMPILMGASMYLMQKMQPVSPTMDPMQQKVMQMMPLFMTAFFIFFPAGLVLYWLMNNLISIAQQLYITNQFNKEYEAKKK